MKKIILLSLLCFILVACTQNLREPADSEVLEEIGEDTSDIATGEAFRRTVQYLNCEETDDGIIISLRFRNRNRKISLNDRCARGYLRDFSCEGNQPMRLRKVCENGCDGNKCAEIIESRNETTPINETIEDETNDNNTTQTNETVEESNEINNSTY